METPKVLDEHYPCKVSAEFTTRERAEATVDQLAGDPGTDRLRIELVVPGDRHLGSKVEPEDRGIFRTAWKSHLVLGLTFLLLGLLIAWSLTVFGPALTRSSPLMVFIALGLLMPMLGLMLAGVVTLRPDHDPLIASTRRASLSGSWTVVVHCVNEEQKQRARELMAS